MSEIKLKPCPFCGGKAMIDSDYIFKNSWKVFCRNCGCGTGIYDGKTPQRAAEAWNRRVDNG